MRGAQFVDPSALARMGNLELVARTVVDGFINGLHRAPHMGFSLDFAEHRGYEPGDDLRRVDWRVFARTDRFYVKQFEADTNANCVVALDVSTSMRFGTSTVTKLDYGRFLAASLLYFSHQQRDRVGFVTFDDRVLEYVPPSARHLEFALYALDRVGDRGLADRAADGSDADAILAAQLAHAGDDDARHEPRSPGSGARHSPSRSWRVWPMSMRPSSPGMPYSAW